VTGASPALGRNTDVVCLNGRRRFHRARAAEGTQVAAPHRHVAEPLALVLAARLLRPEVREFEARSSAHRVQPQQISGTGMPVDAAEQAHRAAIVVEVVERDRVEEASGRERVGEAEVADVAALSAARGRHLPRAMPREAQAALTREPARAADAAARVYDRHARHLAAELGRDVAGHQLDVLHHPEVDALAKAPMSWSEMARPSTT
jgi:hypothetical protein